MKSAAETRKRRGRPRKFDREQALERALDLFWTRGYEATSLADLTEAMGIAPPSLYAAFGSKEQLFFEALERYGVQYGAIVERALEEGATAREAVERLLAESARLYTLPGKPRGCFVVAGAANCTPAAASVERTLRELRRRSEARLRARLERAVREGELPAGADVDALAAFVAAVTQGMSQHARDGASRAELEAIARTALAAWPAGPGGAPRRRSPRLHESSRAEEAAKTSGRHPPRSRRKRRPKGDVP